MVVHGSYNPFHLTPMSGALDNRSTPDEMKNGSPRMRQNFMVDRHGKVGRIHGWSRFLDRTSNYNNQDLHDQLIPLQQYYTDTVPPASNQNNIQVFPSDLCGSEIHTLNNDREAVTFMHEMLATNGSRRAIAGTQSRLYELNEATGNWRLIGDGLGGDSRSDSYIRWQAAQIRDTIIFSNGLDIVYYKLDETPSGCSMQSVHKVQDLVNMNVSSAKAIAAYKNMIFLGCTVEDGGWVENRVRWSNATIGEDAMLDWPELGGYDIASGSVADFQDLDYGHKVMRILPLGDWLMIYTNIGIYRGNLTGTDDPIVSFEKIYESRAGDGCLAFPFSLVSTGDEHYWMSRNGIFKINQFSFKPELVTWLHSATNVVFDDLNLSDCNGQVAGFDPRLRSIWFSYSRGSSFSPSESLVVFPEKQFASTVDHGFNCFCTYRSDVRLTYRDFLREICVCKDFDAEELFLKEGLPIAMTCESVANWIYSSESFDFDGIDTENWWAAEAASDSVCRLLGGAKLEDFCRECNEDQLFVAVSAEDWCIKQMDLDSFGREMCINGLEGGQLTNYGYISSTGLYASRGYVTRIVFGPMYFGDREIKKNLAKLQAFMEMAATDSVVGVRPGISMRVGASYYPSDPLSEDCGVLWSKPIVKEMRCPLNMTPEQYKAQNLFPAGDLSGPFFVTGRFLYLDIRIGAINQGATDVENGVGGASSLSRITMHVRKAGF